MNKKGASLNLIWTKVYIHKSAHKNTNYLCLGLFFSIILTFGLLKIFNKTTMSILDKKALTFLENYLNNAAPTGH